MKKYALSEIFEIIGGGTPKTTNSEYWNGDIPWLSVKDFNSDEKWVDSAEKSITEKGLKESSTSILHPGDLIVSARGTVGALAMVSRDMAFNQSCYGLRAKKGFDIDYTYYLLKGTINELKANTHGSVFDTITRDTFDQIFISVPEYEVQKKIGVFLSNLDEKIRVNTRINKNLLDLIDTVFKQKILKNPSMTTWKQKSLLDIATFQNGLPMQKFRPHENEEHPLKVIKIKELSNKGFSETSELCSATIDKRQIVNDGDLLFSWSGTLLADFWTGGSGGLNQHLYKVTPKNYPIWFIYCWLKYHLREFQSIAKAKATTMGHIKRSDLENAAVYIPPVEELESLNKLLNPIQRNLIVNRITSRTLSKTRDELLPQLLSGEIEIQ